MPVFHQAAVAHLGEAEYAFDHPDRMLDARPHARLPSIGRAPLGRRGTTMGEVARVGRTHAEDGAWPAYAESPQTRRSSPCNSQGRTWLSWMLAGVASTE